MVHESMTQSLPTQQWVLIKKLATVVMVLVSVSGHGGGAIGLHDAWASPSDGLSKGYFNKGHRFLGQFDIRNIKVPIENILWGGVRKDGIPALTEPRLSFWTKTPLADPKSRVIGVVVNGEARAYPINILDQHEIVNDILGGRPIAVVYCPLCDSASVVDRRLNGKEYQFGVSGMLYHSNVLLYDRTDHALWSQVGFMAITGPNAGKRLQSLDGWQISTLEVFGRQYPRAAVISDTGLKRDYSQSIYADYFATDNVYPQFANFQLDRRMLNKTPIIGVKLGELTRAYPLSELAKLKGKVLADQIGRDQAIKLALTADGGAIRIIQIPPQAQVIHTFWFAWAAFYPDTQVYQSSGTK